MTRLSLVTRGSARTFAVATISRSHGSGNAALPMLFDSIAIVAVTPATLKPDPLLRTSRTIWSTSEGETAPVVWLTYQRVDEGSDAHDRLAGSLCSSDGVCCRSGERPVVVEVPDQGVRVDYDGHAAGSASDVARRLASSNAFREIRWESRSAPRKLCRSLNARGGWPDVTKRSCRRSPGVGAKRGHLIRRDNGRTLVGDFGMDRLGAHEVRVPGPPVRRNTGV